MVKINDEIVVIGPTIWGEYLRQGERGVVLSFNQNWNCFYIKMNSDGHNRNYPPESLEKYNEQ